VNIAKLRPALTLVVDGTRTAGLSLRRLTVAPPTGAGALRLTVPVEVPGPTSAVGLKASELTTTGTGLTIRVTWTVWGELEAPVAVMVMVAL
jgi:hypothetical protein